MNASDGSAREAGTAAPRAVLVPLAEAAKLMGIHRATAYQQYKRGDFPLPVMRIGTLLKVNKVHLDEFLAGTYSSAS